MLYGGAEIVCKADESLYIAQLNYVTVELDILELREYKAAVARITWRGPQQQQYHNWGGSPTNLTSANLSKINLIACYLRDLN